MTDQLQSQKSQIRAHMRDLLAQAQADAQHTASIAACTRLMELEPVQHATSIMLYMPLPMEVDLTPAAIRCFQTNKTICVPRVDWDRSDMMPVEVSSFDDHAMETDKHGVRTPRDGRPVPIETIDVVIVPGLAFDAHGHRLGRGAGYYDRFLPKLRKSALAIGLAFDRQVIDEVPTNEDDYAMDIVVTDRRVTFTRRTHSRR